MNPKFNDDAKEQVRLRADIVSVIGRYVNLKPNGQKMKGLCPFHKEKTPSFFVDPLMGVYYCFGCGKGGDVFRFVQDMEGVGFREALEMLAEETGVPVEIERDPYDPAPPESSLSGAPLTKQPTKTELLAIHAIAADFYYQCVKKYPQAVDYFKSRGLKAETVKEFRLGYAPPAWSELCNCLRDRNIPQSQIIEAGLAVGKDGGGAYDRFRDRVMFPLFGQNERVTAFAGRGLGADSVPKYLNSPETALYKKSGVLYGLHKAREHIRESKLLFIVEGYMDYLTLYQAGVRNAVAASGTAFTDDHAALVRRVAPDSKIILVFDGDRAGLSAAERAAFVLAPYGLQVEILALPDGDDPDSFVKREGPGAFMEMSKSAKASNDFLVDSLAAKHDGSHRGKSKAIDALMPYARALENPLERDELLAKIALRLRVDRHYVASAFNAFERGGDSRSPIDNYPTANNIPPSGRKDLGALEESFFKIILACPELIFAAREHITPEIFTDTLSANIYSIILDAYAQRGSLDGLSDASGRDPEAARLLSMLIVKAERMENIQDELVQKIILLRRKHIKARMAELREALKKAPDSEKESILLKMKDCGEQLKELDLRE
jgi:DNA primase